jgi:hypothetical protein
MRKLVVVVALLCTFGCQKKEDVVDKTASKKVKVVETIIPSDARNTKIKEVLPLEISVLERSSLGTKLAPDGTVSESGDVFTPGQPVYVTLWLKESPSGLQTSVLFSDAKGKKLDWPRKDMNGTKAATFKLDTTKLPPGEYHAQCYWGMNIEREYTFKLEAKKKR